MDPESGDKWFDKWMRRYIQPRLVEADGMNLEVDSKDQMMHSKQAICDFQWKKRLMRENGWKQSISMQP